MNRLASETSPYLLQHKDNPVHWNPWDAEALARAKSEQKPIFLSIGYSACHWCHVMEHESFENDAVAAVLNEHFVPIKVDREERPDLDDVYMKATQVLSGHGGWPMSVFLTPDLEPFYAGTYFPLIPRYGMPGFPQVLEQLGRAWTNSRDQVVDQAKKVVERVKQLSLSAEHLPAPTVVERPRLDLMDGALEQLAQLFDPGHGGFGGPPKFPHSDDIRLCLWQHAATGDAKALHMAEHTLDNMMRGGIYDQLGGGFARYSVDGEWTVPHFEKMLYDNALLVPAFLEAHALTGREDFAHVARECCEWVLREMLDPEGGIWSTQDADSEGEEGRFYVWQRDGVIDVVGRKHGKLVDVAWGLGESENFEGHAWILRRNKPDAELAAELGLADAAALRAALQPLREQLYAFRDERVHPGTDDKVLASWNGLMIGALARTGSRLGEPRFVQAAERAATFCLETLRPDGRRLLATWRAGKAHIMATLADYAYLAAGLLDLFEATGETRWALEAEQLVAVAREHFADAERGGFFMTADDAEELVARPRDLFDGALPSSNGVMAEVLVRLSALTGDQALADEADRLFALAAPLVQSSPSAFARMLQGLARVHSGARTVVVTGGSGHGELLAAARAHTDPSLAVVPVPESGVPAAVAERLAGLAGRVALDGQAAAYVCRIGACGAPATTVEALLTQLG